MAKSTVDGTVTLVSDWKKLEWESSLNSLSIQFTSELHAGLGRSDDHTGRALCNKTSFYLLQLCSFWDWIHDFISVDYLIA